jgi:hypothetical protein
MCYQVRAVTQPRRTVSTRNQFEDDTFDISDVRELCVPASEFPAACGDGVVNQPNEHCDGSDDDQCPGFCQEDCTCDPTPPVCSGSVSMERCACSNGTSFCDMPCDGGLTCADARLGCVDFCNDEGGGPGDCATATCLDCGTVEPCAAPPS